MSCKKANKNFLSFLDGDLSTEQHKTIQQHLDGCRTCQDALAKLKEVYSLIEDEKKTIEPNPYLATKVWEKIQHKNTQTATLTIPMSRRAIITIAAAGVAFGIVIGTLLNTTTPSQIESISDQNWTQLADDYFPSDMYSPYEEIANNN